ncbi:MAG: hypothetical protein HY698_02945 [Deltaproteobacteria bacterium]|nr:hypothetical protein [Deltaproteobacteria bacterium]
MRFVIVATCALMLAACARGRASEIVTPRDVPAADGAPRVVRVRDLGTVADFPTSGVVSDAEGDGRFVVGELVLIEGKDFGKLPTILIGGRPARVVARTRGGGVVVRIPDGLAPGPCPVEVSHPGGKDARDVELRRLALATRPMSGRIHVLDVNEKDVQLLPVEISVPAPVSVGYSMSGGVGLVLSAPSDASGKPSPGRLVGIGMAAPGGPRVVSETSVEVNGPRIVAIAERAPVMAVVGTSEVQLFSLSDEQHPAPWPVTPLPSEIRPASVIAAAMDPLGTVLALLVPEGNVVAVLDVSRPQAPRLAGIFELLPGERLPAVRDIRFSPDGENLWILAGDNSASISAGKQPIRSIAVRLAKEDGPSGQSLSLAVTGAEVVAASGVPLRLAIPRAQSVASGAAVRAGTSRSVVLASSMDAKLLGAQAALLRTLGEPGMLLRVDHGGRGGILSSHAAVLGAIDVTPDARILLAMACRWPSGNGEGTSGLEQGIVAAPLGGAGKPTFLKIGEILGDKFEPWALGEVKIQP